MSVILSVWGVPFMGPTFVDRIDVAGYFPLPGFSLAWGSATGLAIHSGSQIVTLSSQCSDNLQGNATNNVNAEEGWHVEIHKASEYSGSGYTFLSEIIALEYDNVTLEGSVFLGNEGVTSNLRAHIKCGQETIAVVETVGGRLLHIRAAP
ncbi:MAG: hypothetical protein JWO81_3329 [Alphaproteobacteria bacterium]|nr:hypothetical protein [Alphaproteobacteria bacterium]